MTQCDFMVDVLKKTFRIRCTGHKDLIVSIFKIYLNTKQNAKRIWSKVFNVKAALPIVGLNKLFTFLHISVTFILQS